MASTPKRISARIISPRLISLATAVPPHVFTQQHVAEVAENVFADRFSDYGRLSRVFANAGIRKRHMVEPIEWYLAPRGWSDRSRAYLTGAQALFEEAATKALNGAGLRATDIDTIVTISSTGVTTPSLEARAAASMGFRADVQRVPVFGLGCAGGVSGFSIAARLAKASPGTNVLMVAVELCSMSFQLDDLSKANIVATALFGDGAAACVLRCDEEGFESQAGTGSKAGLAVVEASGEHLWPDTLDIMGWDVGDKGLGVIFDRAIPPFALANMGTAIGGILEKNGLALGDIDRFICHPGGTKVVNALETSLGLNQGALNHEREVLAEFGNMSAPTVLFVLERVLAAGLPPRSALTAMGPGFTASCAVLKRAA